MNSIVFEKGHYGTRAVIRSAWDDAFLQLLLKEEIRELELNTGKGWRGENVDFLKFLPDLELFTIIDQNIASIKDIHGLNKLKSINISTYCNTPIDFSYFPDLLSCSLEWRKGSESLFECKSLKNLGLNRYDNKTSTFFSKLINLERLTVLNSKIENLEGLSSLINLCYLSLVNLKNLKVLDGIGDLINLEELEIQRCKGISNISEVFNLRKLTSLLLLDLGAIDSIEGLGDLSELRTFLFYESTNILDGNISPLTELKKLSKISFQNRRHYTHKREAFGKLFS